MKKETIGLVLVVLAALFLIMDAGMKLAMLQPVIDTTGALGWPTDAGTIRTLGVILLIATALYLYPKTSLLGAVLITGYLGGAIATHMRIGSPLFSHTLFGVYVGLIVWGGLYLRDANLRVLFPIRK
jgi:hypothetical protein